MATETWQTTKLAELDIDHMLHPVTNLFRHREAGPLILARGEGSHHLGHRRQALPRCLRRSLERERRPRTQPTWREVGPGADRHASPSSRPSSVWRLPRRSSSPPSSRADLPRPDQPLPVHLRRRGVERDGASRSRATTGRSSGKPREGQDHLPHTWATTGSRWARSPRPASRPTGRTLVRAPPASSTSARRTPIATRASRRTSSSTQAGRRAGGDDRARGRGDDRRDDRRAGAGRRRRRRPAADATGRRSSRC